MNTLTETAYFSRKTINYGIIGIIIFIILRIIWSLFINYWTIAHPPPPPPPNVLYGNIPPPVFPKEGFINNLTFKLETATGSLPESSPSAKVYFMPAASANLLSLDRASEKAIRMGFNGNPISLNSEEYLWTDPQIPLRTLKVNIVTGNISLRYDYREDQTILQDKNLPSEAQAIEEAKNILKNYDLSRDDLENGDIKVQKLLLQGGMLVDVGSISESDFIRVQFQRNISPDIQIVTPGINLAPAVVTISGSQDAVKRVIEIDFNYQLIDKENSATYPIKDPSSAWEELKGGKGYVANRGDMENNKVIRNIYIAYYDSLKPQTYLEPVYVFEGDNNFKAYVTAITNDYLEPLPK